MYTIGEFSKLSGISSRMLRHYDAVGLLRPLRVGEDNGYRYYDLTQLPILMQIEHLKGYGFTLAHIGELLTLPQEELTRRIHARRLEAYEELNSLRKTLRHMEDEIMKMEGKNMCADKYRIIVMNTPPQRVFGIRKRISIGEVKDLFDELLSEMEKRGLKRAGACQLVYHGKEFSYDDMDVEAQVQVFGEGEGAKDIPPETCVATTHIGPYDGLKYAYEALGEWMGQHPEYQISGPAIERYIKDVDTAADPEELETGILFPVTKVQ